MLCSGTPPALLPKYCSLCYGITTLIPDLLVMPTYSVFRNSIIIPFSCPIDFIIGFEQTANRVSESQSILEVCVCVKRLADTVEFPEGFEVSLAANTIRGTAAGELIV